MRPEEFLKLLRPKPFLPMRVHMSDGSVYEVRHPEMAVPSRHGLVIGLDERDGISEDYVYCSWLQVTHVADLRQAGTAAAG